MQSPEPEAHDKVLDSNSDQIRIWKCRCLKTALSFFLDGETEKIHTDWFALYLSLLQLL